MQNKDFGIIEIELAIRKNKNDDKWLFGNLIFSQMKLMLYRIWGIFLHQRNLYILHPYIYVIVVSLLFLNRVFLN